MEFSNNYFMLILQVSKTSVEFSIVFFNSFFYCSLTFLIIIFSQLTKVKSRFFHYFQNLYLGPGFFKSIALALSDFVDLNQVSPLVELFEVSFSRIRILKLFDLKFSLN